MKKTVFLLVSIIIFSVLNFLIYQKENILESGKSVILKLAPRDPRSLIQGDYMRLRYDLPIRISGNEIKDEAMKGKIVIKFDSNNVAEFDRFYKGEDLKKGEQLLVYRRKRNIIRIAAESFFFQEGHAKYYDSAQYGELKVDESGNSVLYGLRDRNLNIIKPPKDVPE